MFRIYARKPTLRRKILKAPTAGALITILISTFAAVAGAEEPVKNAPTIKEGTATFLSGGYDIHLWSFEPTGAGRRPAVLVLPGLDGIKSCEKQLSCVARRLAAKGYAVFLVDYFDRTPDQALMPAIQQAFKNCLKGTPTIAQRQELRNYFENWIRAIRDGVGYVRKRPEVDENRVGLIGLSLGGYLAVSVAAEKESRLAAVVECFGGLETEITKDVKNLPPTLVIHDEKDQTVPVKEAYALLGRLVANNVPHEFKVYTGVGHVFMDDKGNFNLLAALNAETRTVAFLEKYLKGAAVASAPPRS